MPATNVQVPGLGESVSEAVLIKWHKQDGQAVAMDEPIAELETDKANVDVPSPAAGVIRRTKQEGSKVRIGETIATIDPNGTPTQKSSSASATSTPAPKPAPTSAPKPTPSTPAPSGAGQPSSRAEELSPAVRRLVDENNLDPARIEATGPGGRITKEDVLKHLEQRAPAAPPSEQQQVPPKFATDTEPAEAAVTMTPSVQGADGPIRRVPMSKIRKKIAERLVNASTPQPSSRRSTRWTSRTSWRCGPSTRKPSRRSTTSAWAS